jgi:phosphoglycolate phosphatase
MTIAWLDGARIAFDLDGTLVDTAPDLVRALNESIDGEGLEPVPLDAVRAMVGRGARALIVQAYERAGRAAPLDEMLDRRLDVFLRTYRAGIADRSRPFEGVEAGLEILTQAGARLSVCTNKPGWLARPLLQTLDLERWFDRITGADEAPASKPDPRHLIAAFGGGASCPRAALVGDSEPDVLAARAAGAASLIFEGGYSEKPASALGADRLFRHWDELPAALAETLSTRG